MLQCVSLLSFSPTGNIPPTLRIYSYRFAQKLEKKIHCTLSREAKTEINASTRNEDLNLFFFVINTYFLIQRFIWKVCGEVDTWRNDCLGRLRISFSLRPARTPGPKPPIYSSLYHDAWLATLLDGGWTSSSDSTHSLSRQTGGLELPSTPALSVYINVRMETSASQYEQSKNCYEWLFFEIIRKKTNEYM